MLMMRRRLACCTRDRVSSIDFAEPEANRHKPCMALTSLVGSLQELWVAFNIRGFMIITLSMQLLLAIVSPVRRRTSNRWVILVIWSAYFVADWVAIFTFGLISNAKCMNPNSIRKVEQDLLAFWSSFLLVHLGGPDSITAYALEDNTLWLRHLVGLVAQLLVFLNIFVKTLPDNKFFVPTILIAIVGAIKYGERTRALYLASLENLKKSAVTLRHRGLNSNVMRPEGVAPQTNLGGSNDDQEIQRGNIKKAFHYFQIFRGLVVDMMPDHSQWLEGREFFLGQDARTAFVIVTTELKFLYEVFYTKVLAANSKWGVLVRSLAFYSVLAALIMFSLLNKEGILRIDVLITYSLLVGVLVLDSAGEIMLARSDWTAVDATYLGYQVVGHGLVFFVIVGLALLFVAGFLNRLCCHSFADRKWSESTGALSLLAHGFEESRPRKGFKLPHYCREINGKIYEKMGVVVLGKLPYQWRNKFDEELWGFIFTYLQGEATSANDADKVRAVYEARGKGPLRRGNTTELFRYVDDFEFEKSLLIWHCATEICYQVDVQVDGQNDKMRMFSKILSDYMAHLLIKQPKLMSPVAGIEQIRYRDTRAEAKNIGMRHPSESMEQFCRNILEEHAGTAESDDRSGKGKSVLSDACNLANSLRQTGTKWNIISEVWVELLSYTAGHCRADSHARLLSEGGEFITFVWLLMAHFGIVPRFPKE